MRRVRFGKFRLYLAIGIVPILTSCAARPTPPAAAPKPQAAISDGTAASAVLAEIGTDRELAQKPGAIAVPIGGGINLVCVMGRGAEARLLTDADLPTLGLDRSGVVALAEANAEAGLRPLSETIQPQPPGTIGQISGDLDSASHLLLHDDWARTASAMGGKLLVAAPSSDILLYADGSSPGAADMLSRAAQHVMASAGRPLSATVLRWTRTGWDVALAAPAGNS
jgi:hypothetical protein